MRNLFLFLAIIPVLGAFGQKPDSELRPENRDEIESMKVAYITQKVNLTTEEAKKFWPVYNEWSAEKDAHPKAGRKFRKQFKDGDGSFTAAELDNLMANHFAHEREAVAIEERYYNAFKKVISTEKLAAFYEAEREFKRFLLGKLRDRKNGEQEGNRNRR